MITITKSKAIADFDSKVIIAAKGSDFTKYGFNENELRYINDKLDTDAKLIKLNQYPRFTYISILDDSNKSSVVYEKARKAAHKLHADLNAEKIRKITLIHDGGSHEAVESFAVGLGLSNYQFLDYYKAETKKEKQYTLEEISIHCDHFTDEKADEQQAVLQSVFLARDLVNKPLNKLNAVQLAEAAREELTATGCKVEIMDKATLEKLGMGGILAVNFGSIDPPTLSIIEWKPENAKNDKPFALVGKGVVYDTGGISLKPTKDSMDYMKSDMGGAAAVIGAMKAISAAKLPVHVVALVPATDNRPDGNAYVPGDVIKMYNGLTVEVLNTDAEGRMILADALSYAKEKYDPVLTIDVATLTGAAARAIGNLGPVAMTNEDGSDYMKLLKDAGENVYERIAEFPFWEEYSEQIKSDIADLKNIGGAEGGAITAGKFLENFASKPYIHIDIAGPAFNQAANSYHGKGGSGVGVRLLYNFFRNM